MQHNTFPLFVLTQERWYSMIYSMKFYRKTVKRRRRRRNRLLVSWALRMACARKWPQTLVSVRRRPRIDVTTIHPTKKNDTCWLQNAISISRPHQCTAISIPRVTGSFLPTRSKMMFIVQMKIFHRQYKLKKCPKTLKYLPCNVRAHRWRSCMLRSACTSRNNCRDNSSKALISNRSCPISVTERFV